jgi:hypothetical protein
MSFVDCREQLSAEAGRWVKEDMCKIRGSIIMGKPTSNRTISLGRLVRYAPFIVV